MAPAVASRTSRASSIPARSATVGDADISRLGRKRDPAGPCQRTLRRDSLRAKAREDLQTRRLKVAGAVCFVFLCSLAGAVKANLPGQAVQQPAPSPTLAPVTAAPTSLPVTVFPEEAPQAATCAGTVTNDMLFCDMMTTEEEEGVITTELSDPVEEASTVLQVKRTKGMKTGAKIVIAPGTRKQETNDIAGFGSITLKYPVKFSHKAGTEVSAKTGELDFGEELKLRTHLKLANAKNRWYATGAKALGAYVEQWTPLLHRMQNEDDRPIPGEEKKETHLRNKNAAAPRHLASAVAGGAFTLLIFVPGYF